MGYIFENAEYSSAKDVAEFWLELRLVPPLLHGDEAHQAWLRTELKKWIPALAQLIEDQYDHGVREGRL